MILNNIDYSKVKIKGYVNVIIFGVQFMSHDTVKIDMILGPYSISIYVNVDDTNIKTLMIENTTHE